MVMVVAATGAHNAALVGRFNFRSVLLSRASDPATITEADPAPAKSVVYYCHSCALPHQQPQWHVRPFTVPAGRRTMTN